jgi:hypothetical protein
MAELREVKFSIRSTSASSLQLLIPPECLESLQKQSYPTSACEYSDDDTTSESSVVVSSQVKQTPNEFVSYWDWPANTVTESLTSDDYWAEAASPVDEVAITNEILRSNKSISKRVPVELLEHEKHCYWNEKTYGSATVVSDNYWYGC